MNNEQEIHMNAPVRNCRNCAHCAKDKLGPEYDYCNLHAHYCQTSKIFSRCVVARDWRHEPPKFINPHRRSLLRWLVDTFFRL